MKQFILPLLIAIAIVGEIYIFETYYALGLWCVAVLFIVSYFVGQGFKLIKAYKDIQK